MKESNSQRGMTRRIISPTNSIIILPANRLSFEPPQQQQPQRRQRQRNVNSNLDIFPSIPLPPPQRNIFGPVSYAQLKFLNLLNPPKKSDATSSEVKEAKEENANGQHVFLMDSSRNFVGENSREISESEKADRALFAQNIMLSILQQQEK